MDGMTLITEAEAAGMAVRAVGDKLTIRGPRRLANVAQRLMAAKPLVIAALRSRATGVPHELSFSERVDTGYVNPGWTWAAWVERLRYLADRCEGVRPELAALYRTWAINVEARRGR